MLIVQTGRPHLPPATLQAGLFASFSFLEDLPVSSLGSPAVAGSRERKRERASKLSSERQAVEGMGEGE